jgi:hypothetical protein
VAVVSAKRRMVGGEAKVRDGERERDGGGEHGDGCRRTESRTAAAVSPRGGNGSICWDWLGVRESPTWDLADSLGI